jgi:exodeoxyribonuclease VII large subunit
LRSVKTATRERATVLDHLVHRFQRMRPAHALKQRRELLHQMERRLIMLGPAQVLGRGYSITLDEASGAILRGPKEAKPGQRLRTKLSQGDVLSRVEKTKPPHGEETAR